MHPKLRHAYEELDGAHLDCPVQGTHSSMIVRLPATHLMEYEMRLAPAADGLGKIARLLEGGTMRTYVATVYALQDAAQAWKDMAENRLPSGPGAARRRSHGKIVLHVA
jgi:hypothetical protein